MHKYLIQFYHFNFGKNKTKQTRLHLIKQNQNRKINDNGEEKVIWAEREKERNPVFEMIIRLI